MYKIYLEEFDSTLDYEADKLCSRSFAYILKENDWVLQYCVDLSNNECNAVVFADEFWVDYEEGEKVKRPINLYRGGQYDFDAQTYRFLEGGIVFSDGITYVAFAGHAEDWYLVSGILNESEPRNKIKSRFFPGLQQFQKDIIARSEEPDDPALYRFDNALNVIWKTPLSSNQEGVRGLTGAPQLFEDVIYLNLPDQVKYYGPTPMAIGAFSAETGEPLWTKTLPCCVRNADLHEGEVYIASEFFLQIRDVRTGEITWELEPCWDEGHIPCHLIPLNGEDLLINFQFKSLAWILDRETKTITQRIHFPSGSGYCFSTMRWPQKHGKNRWLWSTEFVLFTHNMRNSALVTIDYDEAAPPQVDTTVGAKPRPKHTLKGVSLESGEKEYILTIDHDDLDEVVRYAMIILQNFAHEKGRCAGISSKPDRKHNGKIHVEVIRKTLDTMDMKEDEVLERLNLIKLLTERRLNSVSFKAGNKKDKFSIDVALV